MNNELLELLLELNPWLKDGKINFDNHEYIPRLQTEQLLSRTWDKVWLILTGPRQAGKTTLGNHIANILIKEQRFEQLVYLNCDFLEIREWLKSPLFIKQVLEQFNLKNPIFFIDEVQRLVNPGLLLKGIADLKYPIKMMASGSSQLEIKSKVQEYLTGRHFEALILPFSYEELSAVAPENLIFGCYPDVVLAQNEKALILKQLYQDYIQKDIIEILKINNPDVMQKLIILLAHASGQLVNYEQLAIDCKASVSMINHYCAILEATFTIVKIKPFVGNKRKEIVKNPIYYFIDNGFRNQALKNLSTNNDRVDMGFLIESAVFQEIYKFKNQYFLDFDIHFWRTQSGAEIDFILYKNDENIIPIEVKYRKMTAPKIGRSMHSFIEVYKPKMVIIITKEYNSMIDIKDTTAHFISFDKLLNLFSLLEKFFKKE